jgi:dTDP-glucose 4,6-dehydratase
MRPHDGRAIPTFVRQALAEKPLTVFGDGAQTRSFCYASDMVEGLLRLISCDHHEPVNLGNPGEFTILELAELLIEVTGSRSEIVHEALPQDDPAVRRPDVSRARELLGWEPTVELREGLLMTLDGMGVEVPLPR